MIPPHGTDSQPAAPRAAVPLGGARQSRRARVQAAAGSGSRLPVLYLYGLWSLIIFDWHRWLASMGPGFLNRMATLFFLPLVILMLVRGPMIVAWAKSWMLQWPFLAYVAFAVGTVPLAYNRSTAWETVQALILFYLLGLGTMVLIRTARDLVPILLMFLFQFAWWAYHARLAAIVYWHPGYANFDAMGSLFVMGIGIGFYYGMAAEKKWLTWAGYLLCGYCVLGIVSSFARGAVLAMGAVLLILWWRSPRKLVATAGAIAAVILVVGGSALLFEEGTFWQEMQSVFTEGTSEGTGRDRWELWQAAIRVWEENPIIGVGAQNFGPFAADYFAAGEIPGYENPGRLYSRNLHNAYFQILSEFGIVGSALFVWLLIDFFWRHRRIRQPECVAAWHQLTGGILNLRYVSLGLELAMIGFLINSLFYAQLYEHWMYTLLIATYILFGLSRSWTGSGTAPPRSPSRPSRWGPAAPVRPSPPPAASSLRPSARRQLPPGPWEGALHPETPGDV